MKVKVKTVAELEVLLKPYHKCTNGTLWFSAPNGDYKEFKASMFRLADEIIEVRKVRSGLYVQDNPICDVYYYYNLWWEEWLDIPPVFIELEGLENE